MPNPPRKRFQIHLSTAIVMMFVAGGLIWLNLRETFEITGRWMSGEHVVKFYRGFPVKAWAVNGGFIESATASETDFRRYKETLEEEEKPRAQFVAGTGVFIHDPPGEFQWIGIAADATLVIVILLATWFLCEWLIRRRAARKGS